MKRIVISLIVIAISLAASAKTGILVAQFGTSNDEGRTSALDKIFSEIKSRYSAYDVREAYTSPTIRRALNKKGIKKDSVTDALLRMHLDGVDTVVVQPTFLLDGVEMQMLRDEVKAAESFFNEVRVGVPLLYTIADFKEIVSLLKEEGLQKGNAIMYVGHGNEYASTSAYTMLTQMLQASGSVNSFVGTIEGWPDMDTSVAQLSGKKYKTVTLVPFLLACGVHAHEDIDGEWRPALEEAGYKVDVYFHGLGERADVRNLILEHLCDLIK